MSENKNVGALGESLAVEYMKKKGYETVCRNYHGEHGEIDFVCKNDERLIFVEVKTRKKSKSMLARPAAAVNYTKRQRLLSAVNEFLYENSGKYGELLLRIDVIEVFLDGADTQIVHIENAVGQVGG